MKVLLIGYPDSGLRVFLENEEDLTFIDGSEEITLEKVNAVAPEFIVLHGCHSILEPSIVEHFPKKIINLHGAYLPWNRGGHPNVWSFVEGTPRGGSIHFIDEKIDCGELIARAEIDTYPDDTLSTTYFRIRDLMEKMFIDLWSDIKKGNVQTQKLDSTGGSYHAKSDLTSIEHLLPQGWETKITDFLHLVKNDTRRNEVGR